MRATLRQTKALALLTLRHWARAGVPNRLRKDQGRRASGAVLRGAFFLLMVNWGYRIGLACVRLDHEHRPNAVAWLLVGLACLSVTWGAMGRGPGMRAPQSVLTSPLLDALPLREASRVLIGLVESVVLFALATAALSALAPRPRVELLLLGLALPTAGLLTGDALLRLLRTVVSPMRMGRVAVVVLVLQFPAFMLVGGAPVLAKLPRVTAIAQPFLRLATALLGGGPVLPWIVACVALAVLSGLLIRAAERIGYDHIDIVPVRKQPSARSADLDLVRIERVLAKREPGGRWLVRGAFFYTLASAVALVAAAAHHAARSPAGQDAGAHGASAVRRVAVLPPPRDARCPGAPHGSGLAVAFLTQGLGGVKVLGGNLGLETTLVAMPLLAVAAAPYPWSAAVSVAALALLAHAARRSALRCIRWIDDAEEHSGETVVWRALLVFATFEAAQTLGRRLLAFAPMDDGAQAASAYAFASSASRWSSRPS